MLKIDWTAEAVRYAGGLRFDQAPRGAGKSDNPEVSVLFAPEQERRDTKQRLHDAGIEILGEALHWTPGGSKFVLLVRSLTLRSAGAVLACFFWPRPPALIRELRALPEVALVEYSGTASNYLAVIHLRDWRYVPKELLDLEGVDHDEHLADVEKPVRNG